MRQVPECLQRRYQVMDTLINDLNSASSYQGNNHTANPDDQDYGIKLMCKFWNILKEDPYCDLQNVVQQQLTQNTRGSGIFGSHNITCYQASKDDPNTGKQYKQPETKSETNSLLCDKHKHAETKCSTSEKHKQPETNSLLCDKHKHAETKSSTSEKNKQPETNTSLCEKHKQHETKSPASEKHKQPETKSPTSEKHKQPETNSLLCEKHKPSETKCSMCEKQKQLETKSPASEKHKQPETNSLLCEKHKPSETKCSMCEKQKQLETKSSTCLKHKQPETKSPMSEKHKQPETEKHKHAEIKSLSCEKHKQPETISLTSEKHKPLETKCSMCEKQKQLETHSLCSEKYKQPEIKCSSCQKYKQSETNSPLRAKHKQPESMTPLTHAMANMKEAASMEKRCCEKTAELLSVQDQLKVQIAQLEQREEREVKLLKEADAMWKKMEDEYKQKLLESKQRQEELLKQVHEVEISASKWKTNKKNLEDQVTNANKAIQEIKDRYKKKTNDLKTLELETADLEKKLEINTRDIMNASKALEAKRKSFDERMKKLSEESKTLQITKKNEDNLKNEKIQKGNECIKEAREELTKLCRVLLKKRLENENLRAEATALAEEIDLLKTTCDTCTEKCKHKEQSVLSDIEKCKTQIEQFQLRCTKCNVSSDTINLRKYCTDCLRCQETMDPCIYTDGACKELAMNDCVCVRIKNHFMNNVFDNMQTVLERQIKTKPGKAVAAQVLRCLKNSTNGKLDLETRRKLQDFILATVKTNLNLTIIGGAVKTRCEMDPDTYQELMKCLCKVKSVKHEKPEKVDKGTHSRKEPCARWSGPYECNCPKGPKDCICMTKAPKPPSDSEPCWQLDEDKEDIGELSMCPHKEKTPCGPLCGNDSKSDTAQKAETSWKPKPCSKEKCTFKNMRAAQCTLGNECITKRKLGTRDYQRNAPIILVPSDYDQTLTYCDCVNDACDCYENFENQQNQGCQRKSRIRYETKLNEMFNHNNTTLPITVKGQNGITANFNAELKKTHSGHMSLDVGTLSNVGEIASPMAEYPVSLFESSSSFMLIIGENYNQSNAVLKRSSTGEINVILKNVNVLHKNNNAALQKHVKLFHVIIKNKEANYSKCVIVRSTPSGNFEFVLDKEFEKWHKKVINDCLGDINKCPVNISRMQSGTWVLDFDEGCNCHQHYHNALLKKSDSGNVKLIANVTDSKILKKDKCSIDRCRSKFECLYEKLSTFTKYLRKECLEPRDLGNQLECSLQKKTDIRISIQDQNHFIAELFVRLNHVSLGKYSVIFKNKGEELFIGNLLTSWLGRLPIQKFTKQELTVFLNRDEEVTNVYGWLKMSSNGEIIVVL